MNISSNSKSMPQTVVAHLGARLHYGAAEVLNNQGMLKKLFTDFYLDRNALSYKILNEISRKYPNSLIKKVLNRSSSIHRVNVTSFPFLGLRYWLELAGSSADTDVFLKFNQKFGNKVARTLPELAFNAVYGFSGSSLEMFEISRQLDASTFLEQMSAPVSVSQDVISSEMERWPGWQNHFSTQWNVEKWQSRELKEWEMADYIIAPSPYIEKLLCGYNINQSKIARMPYAVSLAHYPPKQRSLNGREKLKTVYVGDLRLLKGIPYLLNAINDIGSEKVDLACIGSNYLNHDALAPYLDTVRFIGALPRREVLKWYDWADVLVMPSLCEGSSTVTYEAKASGLPIIATLTSGAWIEDGIDGINIQERSSEAIVKALEQFLLEPGLLNQMSASAIDRRQQFGWEAYQENLFNLITH